MRPLETTDLTRHLIRRELVSSGLLTFDDCPENYWAWKTSFQSVTRDFNLTAREELDMLVKWLGPESSQQAKRIRSVHAHNPALGVQMAWHRLEECYGSSEVIEDALLKKLENFPKISNKDKEKLRELGDLLLEIDAAKSGGHLPGLAYLDTARGVKPIIENCRMVCRKSGLLKAPSTRKITMFLFRHSVSSPDSLLVKPRSRMIQVSHSQ